MGLASHRSPIRAGDNVPGGVGIIDTIEIRESSGSSHPPGLVVVLDGFASSAPQTFVGVKVRLKTPSGEIVARVEDVRDHGATISLFFPGLTRTDVPDGSRVEFEG